MNTTSREWGTSKNKATSDYLASKSGTNIEPEIYQSQSHKAEKIKYDTGKNGDNPLYEATNIDSQRKLQQIGSSTPVGHSSDHVKRVKYDDKSKKYITTEESKDSNVIDSITLQMVHVPDDSSSAVNVIEDLSRSNRNVGSLSTVTMSNKSNLTKQSDTTNVASSSSTKQSKTSSAAASNVKISSSDQMKTTNDQNLSDTTTTYTSKVRIIYFSDTHWYFCLSSLELKVKITIEQDENFSASEKAHFSMTSLLNDS